MSNSRPRDPRVALIVKHLRILARRHERRLVVQDYQEYRATRARELPSLTTVYRLMGSWPDALAAAGVERADKNELSRTSDEALVAALKTAGEQLGTKSLSSHAYDDFRKSHPELELPSSSVIRKWLGHWSEAVQRAGLETTGRATPRKRTLAEVIDALREAKANVEGMLTPRSYTEYREALPVEQRERYPDVSHILSKFPNWESALRSADVEQSDELHPQALWSAEEARRIMQTVEKLLGHPPNETEYERIRENAKKPMPAWSVMTSLLSV